MKHLIKYFLIYVLTISACGELSTKNSNEPLQAWNEEAKKLFVCDQTDQVTPKEIQEPVKKQASVLARIFDNTDEITLNSNNFNIFMEELKNLSRLQEISVSHDPDYMTPAVRELEGLKPTGLGTYVIERSKILKAKDQCLVKNDAMFANFQKLFIGHKIIDKSYLFTAYSRMLFDEQLKNNFAEAIKSGFFVDSKNAWSILANFSPLYRKNLQRWVKELPSSNEKETAFKNLLQSVLRSERFTALPNDRHVVNLKSRFGDNIRVEGIARGSVATAYLVSCRYGGADKYFVAKTGVYKKQDLEARLQKELAIDAFNHGYGVEALALIYPDVSMQGVEFKRGKGQITNYKEAVPIIKENIKRSILEDVNFKLEAKNLYELAKSYKSFSAIKIVRGAFESINGEDYLLMEHALGKPLSELASLTNEQALSLNEVLKQLYEQIVFGTGPYHADTHAGNIIVDNTSFKLIDAGRIADLSAGDRKNIQALEFAIDYLEKSSEKFTQKNELNLVQALEAKGFPEEVISMKSPVRTAILYLLLPTSQNRIHVENKNYSDLIIEALSHNNYHNLSSAMRAILAIEDLYREYVQKHGISRS